MNGLQNDAGYLNYISVSINLEWMTQDQLRCQETTNLKDREE